jgi:hypothetical protein
LMPVLEAASRLSHFAVKSARLKRSSDPLPFRYQFSKQLRASD